MQYNLSTHYLYFFNFPCVSITTDDDLHVNLGENKDQESKVCRIVNVLLEMQAPSPVIHNNCTLQYITRNCVLVNYI